MWRRFELQQPAVTHLAVALPASETEQEGKRVMTIDRLDNDRRPTMNRIDITLRATARCASGIRLIAALLALAVAAPAVVTAIASPGRSYEATDGDDTLRGTSHSESIPGYGGSDTIFGRGGHDSLSGDGQLAVDLDGADTIFGGDGNDMLWGFGGADLLVGGRGNDIIDAQEYPTHPPGEDTVRGGRGNDTIFAADGAKDIIDCGPGRDFVQFDQNLDTVTGCEDKTPM